MTGKWNLRLIVVLLLAAIATLMIVFCIPELQRAEFVGFRGHHDNHRFVVSTVYSGSPAEAAGMRAGDVLSAQGGRSVADWYADYRFDRGSYFAGRRSLAGEIPHEVTRAGRVRTMLVTPRSLAAGDMVRLYGVRILLVVLLASLMAVIMRSRTREPAAVLIMMTFGFAGLWLVTDIPDRWEFLSPVLPRLAEESILLMKFMEVLFLQLAIAFLVHVALVFPDRHPLLERHPWLLPANYAGPILVLVVIVLGAGGGVADRLAAVHASRLWINTAVMVAASVLMLTNYRMLSSPEEREKIRWIVVSLVLFVGAHLALWNLPKLVTGHPLVADYQWVLLPMALIPVTLTMSIVNHELFGIRGIIRGRIRLLSAMLERKKAMVMNRDRRIQEMTQELESLNRSLHQFRQAERDDFSMQSGSSFSRLEQRYPEIRDIRRERLLGASPLWEPVLERAVVAARGSTPVMIVGESGTGKTSLAWTVYRLGDRTDRVFREISCAQFEHADPAFSLGRLFGIGPGHGLTNVPKEGRIGLLEECDGGTLFLDDFDRLPLNVQDMLLHPLEGRSFDPGIGAGSARSVSVKFILATNRDPESLVREGTLRGDVLNRIGERIDIPPLRDRPEDIPVLVYHFLGLVSRELGYEITLVSPMALQLLGRYPYGSGNARELQMEIRAAAGKAMLEEDRVLRAGYLSDRLRTPANGTAEAATTDTFRDGAANALESTTLLAVLRKHKFQVKAAEAELGYSHKSRTLSNHLRGLCIEALSDHGWDAASAAAALTGDGQPGVRAKLQRKMERYASTVKANVAAKTESRLYQNLPAAYHEALTRMIHHMRG